MALIVSVLLVAPRVALGQVSFIAAGLADNNNITTASPPAPAGIQANDILVIVAHSRSVIAHAVTTGTGWAQIGTQGGDATGGQLSVWWKRATGTSEPTPTLTATGNAESFASQMFAFRGCVTSGNPWDVVSANTAQAASTTFTGANLTSTVANVMVVFAGGSMDNNGWALPGGSIDTVGGTNPNNAGTDDSTFLGYKAIPSNSPGALGAPTIDQANVGPDAGRWLTFALKPAPAVAIGNGSAEPTSQNLNQGQTLALDTFSVQTNTGTATITAVTVNVPTNATALSALSIQSTSNCTGGTTYGTLSSPVNGDNTVALTTNISATTTSGATDLYVCATGGTVGAATPVTGNVSSVTAAGYTSSDSDSTSATLTVQPPPSGTIAIGDGSDPSPNPTIAPDATGPIDAFTLQTSAGTATLSSVTVGIPSSAADLASISIQNTSACDQATPYGTLANPINGTNAVPVTGLTATATSGSTSVYVCGTARGHAVVIGSPAITATVSSVAAAGYTADPTGDTSSAILTIDNTAPASPASLAGTAQPAKVRLTWTNPTESDLSSVIVVHDTLSIAWTPTDGTTYTSGQSLGGNMKVGCVVTPAASGAAASCYDTYVTSGTLYYFRAFALDQHGNYSAASNQAGPVTPTTFVGEGSTTPGAPMVSIVNPLENGVVSSPQYRLQIRVFNAVAQGGIAGITAGPEYSANNGQTWSTAGIAPRSGYDTYTGATLTGRTYEVTITPPSTGLYVLRARVSSAVVSNVLSNEVPITVVGSNAGDGNLLVRDNSAQLCGDCHAIAPHTSETTSTDKGSWSTTCRDCHPPHGTRNISLVAEQITPPEIAGPQAPKTVVFYNKTGNANQSYASAALNGVCQVCHTRTSYYRADGTSPGGSHDTGPCAVCHKHETGLKGSCTTCHGTEGRTPTVAGTDSRLPAAPPAVATKTGQTVVSVTNGGAHVAHLDKTTWRSAPLQCASCHTIPNTHQDLTQTDVAWTGLASSGGVTPTPAAGAVTASWTATPTCTNWCHGTGLAGGGGSNVGTPPLWTGTSAACGTCHASPPPVDATAAGDHPQNTACASCHGGDYAQATIGPTSKVTHVDGTIQKPENGCTACHGTLAGVGGLAQPNTNYAAAPGYVPVSGPTGVDTRGNSAQTSVRVGSHDAHVNGGMMAPRSCEVCHASKPADGDTTHANVTIAAGFGAPASAEGVTPYPSAFDTLWESSPTCTNFCHSNGKPMGAASATTVTVTWTSTTPMYCYSCHQTGTSLATNAHPMHVSTYGVGCNDCHVGTTTTTNGSAIVAGGGNHLTAAGTKDVSFNASNPYVAGGIYATAQCSNTYCHSNGVDRTAPFTSGPSIAWSTARTCGSCHQAGSGMATQSHALHVSNATYIGANFGCITCHDTVSDDSTINPAKIAQHVNAAVEVPGTSYTDGTANGVADGTCATNACHSNGTETPAAGDYKSVTWGGTDGADGCMECHGSYSPADFTAVYGEPNYANNTGSYKTRNSHKAHVSTVLATAKTQCVGCHSGTVDAAGALLATGGVHLDLNGAADVSGAKIGSYTDATETCNAVTCHGGVSPQWGGAALDCSGCHMGATGATDAEVDDYTYDNGTFAKLDPEDWITYGHGRPTASGNYDSGNGPAAFDTAIAVSTDDGCKYCHDKTVPHGAFGTSGNPFRLANIVDGADAGTVAGDAITEKIGVCTACHGGAGYLGKTSANAIDATHYGSDHAAGGKGGELCWDCHDPHGDYKYSATAGVIGFMIDETPSRTHAVAAGSATEWGQGAIAYAAAPVFRANLTGGATTYDWGDYVQGTSLNGVCQVCHTATAHFLNSVWDATAPGDFDHNTTEGCAVSCHKHDQPAADAFKPAGACSGCHLAAPSAGTDSDVDDYTYGTAPQAMVDLEDWNTYGHGATAAYAQSGNPAAGFTVDATVEGCYYCHAPETAIAGGNGDTSAHGDAADPFRLTNTGGADGKNGACLVCHKTGSPGFDPDGANTTYGAKNRTTSRAVGSTHYGLDHSATADGGAFCWDCHDPHGDYNYTVGTPRAIAYMIHETPTRDHSGSTGWGIPTALGAAVDFNKAAGSDAASFDGGDYVDTVAATYNGVCQVCHTTTAHWLSNGTLPHENGAARCVACHAHEQPASNAFKEATACNGCHNAPPTGGKHAKHDATGTAITSYTSTTNYSTPTAYGFTCGMCHTAVLTNHMDDLGGTAADPYVVDVDFNWDAVVYAQGATTATETHATSGLVFKGTNGSCSTTYCHDPLGVAYTGTAVTWDAAAAALTCAGCHDDAGGQTSTALGNGHTKHTTIAAGSYDYICQTCHANTVDAAGALLTTAGQGKVQHVDNDKNDVKFTAVGGLDQSPGTFTGGATGTCSSTYCHSDGQDRVAPFTSTSIAWNTTRTCGSCHQAGSGMATRSHALHVNNATYIGANFGCITCHDTVSDDSTIASGKYGQHVNAAVEVPGTSYTDGTADNIANGTCATNACHSNGTETLAAGDYKSVTWGGTDGADGCMECHGSYSPADFTAVYGEPNYANNTASYKTRNSHKAHVSTVLATAKTQCVSCHSGTVDAAGALLTTGGVHLDLNGAADVGGTGISSYTDATETCNTVTCHGGGSPQWGATLDCSGCHMGATGATDGEVNNYVYNDGTFAKLDPEDWIGYGHGRPTASGNYDSGNGPAAFDTAIAVSSDDGCKYCHDRTVPHGAFGTSGNPFRLANIVDGADAGTTAGDAIAEKIGVCTVCHGGAGYLGKDSTNDIDATHYGTDHATGGKGGELCWDCHDPHGDYRYTATAQVLGFMIDETPSRTHTVAAGSATEWGQSAIAYAATPVFRAGLSGGATTYDWGDYAVASPYNGVCQVCHTGTSRFLASGTTWTSDSGHNTGQGCAVSCHTHDQTPTDAFKGKGSCLGCHAARAGSIPRAQIVGGAAGSEGDDFIRASRHVSDGTTNTIAGNPANSGIVTDYDCILCHAEGDVTSSGSGASAVIKTVASLHGNDSQTTKTVDLRDVDAASGNGVAADWPKTRLSADVRTLDNGSNISTNDRDKMDRFCMGCHDANGAAGIAVNGTNDGMQVSTNPTGAPVARRMTPFNTRDTIDNARDSLTRTGVLNVKEQFNWQNLTGKNFASHHNLNQFTKRYTTVNSNWPATAWTAYVTKHGQTLNATGVRETAGLHCSDCHLNELNAHGTRNTWYMLADSDLTESVSSDELFTSTGTPTGTDNCFRCHAPAVYGEKGSLAASASRTQVHNGDCAREDGASVGGNDAALIGDTGTDHQIPCLMCHAGGGFGFIHGMNFTYKSWKGTVDSKTYRFQGGGGTWRWYSPKAAAPANAADAETMWEGTANYGCYTLSSADSFGACVQHPAGEKNGTSNYQRNLQY